MPTSEVLQALDAPTPTKLAVFLVVQALVYLILVISSDVFSRRRPNRSLSFKLPARSTSILRVLAAVSEMPPAGEPDIESGASNRRGSHSSLLNRELGHVSL